MFVRQQRVRKGERDYTYLRVVESTRVNGKVVQKTLVNLGCTDAWAPGKLEQVVRVLERFVGIEVAPLDLADVKIADCRKLGPYLALTALWEELGMDVILQKAMSTSKLGLPIVDYCRAMVFRQLAEPCSKLAVHEAIANSVQIPGIGAEDLPLHGYYRALEYLSQVKPAVEQAVHARLSNLFNRDLSLVFYDLTSSYFEGSGCASARHGYSREHRPDCVQIEVGLLVDGDGMPIGHEVFEGNRSDSSTVVSTLERLREEFGLRRCVFVSDDGMASAKNLAEIEARGFEYITSLSLRKSLVANQILEKLPPRRTFTRLKDNLFILPLCTEGTLRYVGSYNPQRAQASRSRRKERLRQCIEKLRSLQAPRRGPGGRGGRYCKPQDVERTAVRFLREKTCSQLIAVGLDQEGQLWWRLSKDNLGLERRRDGLMVLVTNSQTLTDEEIAVGYRTLWRVERAFRHIKDPIRLRPIRHWNEARVRGHVFVCVLAYLLECMFDRRLTEAGLKMTAQAALQHLDTLNVATLTIGDQKVRKRSNLTHIQERIFNALGLKDVPEIW